MLHLSLVIIFVLAASPQALAHDVKVLAEGYSWLENVLPSGAFLPPPLKIAMLAVNPHHFAISNADF
jgi:hypothetical protein